MSEPAPWYLSDPATFDWLHRIYSVLEAAGSALVMGLGTPHPKRKSRTGISDNCYLADQILNWLVDSGWIIPVAYNPSREQRFFGVGGRAPGRQPRSPQWRGSHTYPQEWQYRANLESAGLNAYVRGHCLASGQAVDVASTQPMRSRSTVANKPAATTAPPTDTASVELSFADKPVDKAQLMETRVSINPADAKVADKVEEEAEQRESRSRQRRAEAPTRARDLSMGTHARIVDHLFDLPDPMELYTKLRAGLSFGGRVSSMSYGQLADALDEAEQNAVDAAQLSANMKVALVAYQLDAQVIRASLRNQALEDLGQQKAAGTLVKKTINKDDIGDMIAQMFPDEYRELELGEAKAKRTADAIEALAETVRERARDLRQYVAKSRDA